MKKHFFVFLTALAAAMVSSCKKDNNEFDNPNGSWSVELMAKREDPNSSQFAIELAGTGTFTIDWGDGTVLKNTRMPELKDEYIESFGTESFGTEYQWYEGKSYTHTYSQVGTYRIKITGQDGIITLLNVFHWNSTSNTYSSLVLDRCNWLVKLSCEGNRLTKLLIGQCTQLKQLYCSSNQLTSLNVSKCTQLEKLYCWGNQLTSLDVSKNTQLEWLECSDNELTSLDVSKCTQLETLRCGNDQLTSLNISGCTQLEELLCDNDQLTSLNVSGCTQLEELICINKQQTSSNGSEDHGIRLRRGQLKWLFCYNPLTSLDISGCTQLKKLSCAGNELTSLDVSGCSKLEKLYCYSNLLTSLDVSGCTKLNYLWCTGNRLSGSAMNKIYNDLPVVGQGEGYLEVDKATAGDYYIAENKGWNVRFW